MNRLIRLIAIAFISAYLPVGCSPSIAQEITDDLARSVVDLKQRLVNDTSIAETVKNEITAQVLVAEANVGKIDELKKRIAADQEAITTAATRSANFIVELEKLQKSKPLAPNSAAPITEIETEVTNLKKTVDQLNTDLQLNEQESTRRTVRRQEIRSLLDAADKKLENAQTKIQALSTEDNSLATQAARVVLLTGKTLAETEKSSLTTEQTRYESSDREKVLRNQRDLLAAQLAQSQSRLAEFENLQTEKRQQMARQTAVEAENVQTDIRRENPLLVSSYEINTNMAKSAEKVESRALEAKNELDAINTEVDRIQQQYRDTDRRIRTIGLTGSVGALLRKRKSELPSIRRSLANAEKIKAELNEIQFDIFDLGQQRDELSPAVIRKEIEAANDPQTDSVIAGLEEPIADLIVLRKERLDAVLASKDRLFEDYLREIEYKERVLVNETTKFRDYINQRILWIRSNNLLFSTIEIDATDQALFKPSNWGNALQHAWQAIIQSPIASGFSAFVILLLLMFKPRLRREVDKLGQVASRGSCDTFWPTAQAVVLTILVAITVPLIPLSLGLVLKSHVIYDNPLFNALGPALLAVAWFSIPFEILRRICRPKGLANEHFDWPDSSVAKLRANLGQIIIPGAVIVFFVSLLRNLDQTHHVDLIERLLFVIAMIGFAYFAWRTFNPKHGIFDEYLKANDQSWANQTSMIWFSLILALPVSVAVLAIWGYYYTAINLAECVFGTFVFAVIVETIRELLKRMILVQRRHVNISAARKKRELQLQARREQQKLQLESGSSAASDPSPDSPSANASITSVLEPLINIQNELDIDENAKQANKLISLTMMLVWAIGLWMIWTDVMPALKALDDYTLWPNQIETAVDSLASETVPTNSSATQSTPAPGTAMAVPAAADSISTPPTRITVRNLLVFLVIGTVTLVSARSLPSALEMLLLEQLPFDRSFRYAIKALISYVIVMVGLILAFRALSIGWSNVQWLATALTFGLAFGLQEIFANFVAGIILMFERPIRIGDWITVDEFTGCVVKIRTRATTILNLDRKEYVIPNKDFITGRLINWTLSDAINRVIINVGVAYGSDVEKAKAILFEVCKNHPKTVEDPPPSVIFEGFGDSSLNLVARAFLDDVEGRPKVIDQLNTQINAAFSEAGIVIAFPQRDLHIYSIDEQATESIRGAKRIQDAEKPISDDQIPIKETD